MSKFGNRFHCVLCLTFVVALTAALLATRPAQAQSSCNNVQIIIDATVVIDETAICEAAQPLAAAGHRVLVYLTDFEPSNEDDWFIHLDQVEANAGLRDLNAGTLDRNTLAIESSTNPDIAWARSLTLGENLWGSALDSNASSAEIKQVIQNELAAGDPTGALTSALTRSSKLLGLTTSTASESSGAGAAIVGTVIGLGALGAAGAYAYPRYVKPTRERRRREEALGEHLNAVQERIANLLLGLEGLVGGSSADETTLYQLFDVYGGSAYQQLDKEVRDWLTESQQTVNNAFAIRSKLLDEDIKTERGIEQLVEDWERIYVTLVGTEKRITQLDDKDLHTLLDPMLVLEREPDNSTLANQLNELAADLSEKPLKIELQILDTSSMESIGVLGLLDDVQVEIGRLQEAEFTAPERLAELQTQRDRLAEQMSADALGAEVRLTGVDQTLAVANGRLDAGRHLSVLALCDELEKQLLLAGKVDEIDQEAQARLVEAERVVADGYRPSQHDTLLNEVRESREQLVEALRDSDFDGLEMWLDELDGDSNRLKTHASEWRALHLSNQRRIGQLTSQLPQLAGEAGGAGQRAWDDLQRYPADNWDDLRPQWERATAFVAAGEAQLAAARRDNALDVQAFEAAERTLTDLEAGRGRSDIDLRDVRNRLSEVEQTERNIDTALRTASNNLDQAVRYRNEQNTKISAEVDEMLKESKLWLDNAHQERDKRHFRRALNYQTQADEVATRAYAESSQQVARINELEKQLRPYLDRHDGDMQRRLARTENIPGVVMTEHAIKQLGQAHDRLSDARHAHAVASGSEDVALAKGLEKTIQAYESAETAVTAAATAVQEAVESYQKLLERAKAGVNDAMDELRRAERNQIRGRSGRQWRSLTDRARSTLPTTPNQNHTREQLRHIAADAQESISHSKNAHKAAQQARREQRNREMAAAAATAIDVIGSSRSYGSSPNRPRSSAYRGGTSSRSSRPSISRPRSSGGGSRRSSNMGGSRRR